MFATATVSQGTGLELSRDPLTPMSAADKPEKEPTRNQALYASDGEYLNKLRFQLSAQAGRSVTVAESFRAIVGELAKRKSPPPAGIPFPDYGLTLPLPGDSGAGPGVQMDAQLGEELDLSDRFAGCVLHRVRGDSMVEERIFDGDLVIVKEKDSYRNGDVVVVWWQDQMLCKKLVVKKVRNGPTEQWLKSCDGSGDMLPHHEDDENRILGVLVGTLSLR